MIDRNGQPLEHSSLAILVREAQNFLPLAGRLALVLGLVAGMGLVDGVMLAHQSGRQLAAFGLASVVAAALLAVALAWTLADSRLLAARAAPGHDDEAARSDAWRQALWLALPAGLLVAALGAVAPHLLALVGQPTPMVRVAGQVFTTLCLAVLPALLSAASALLLAGSGRRAWVVVCLLMAQGLNLALNLWLISGSPKAPGMGAMGAALGTAAVHWLLALTLLALAALTARPGSRPGSIRPDAPDGALADLQWLAPNRLWALGHVVGLAMAPLGLTLIAAWTGDARVTQLAALGLVVAPAVVVAFSLAVAAGQRVTAVLQQAHRRAGSVDRLGERLAVLGLPALLVVAVLYALAPQPLLQMMVNENNLVRQLMPMLALALAVVVLEGLALLSAAALRSLGPVNVPAMVQIGVSLMVLVLGALFAVGLNTGVVGLLAAQGLGATARTLLSRTMYRSAAKVYDDATASAIRKRAMAIADGWADTVLLWPAASGRGRRSRQRGRDWSSDSRARAQ